MEGAVEVKEKLSFKVCGASRLSKLSWYEVKKDVTVAVVDLEDGTSSSDDSGDERDI